MYDDFISAPEVNFTRKQIEASNEAILASGRSYSARLVFPLDSIAIVQLIQDRNPRKGRSVSKIEPAEDSSGYEYVIDL